jgi:MFS family permease
MAAMYLILLSVVVLVSKERVLMARQPVATESKPSHSRVLQGISRFFSLHLTRRKDVRIMILISFLSSFAYTAPFYFLPSYALHVGLDKTDAALAVGILSALNAVGRIFFGQLAVQLGSVNMFFVATSLAGLFCAVVWPFASSYGMVVVFAVLYGLASGGYISLYTSVTSECSTLQDLSSTLGLVFSVSMFGNLVGPTVFGVLLDATNGSYLSGQLFCAAFFLLASGGIVWLRTFHSHSTLHAV